MTPFNRHDPAPGQPGVAELVRADLHAMAEGEPLSRMRLAARLAVHVRWRAVVYWRLAQAGMKTPITKPLALWLTQHITAISAAELQPAATIGPGLVLKHTTGLVVGGEVVAGARLTLHQNVTLGDKHPRGGQPRLGDDVTVGAGACILGPIMIGNGVTVAANSVVNAHVPDGCVVAGAPARIVRRFESAVNEERATRQPVRSMNT